MSIQNDAAILSRRQLAKFIGALGITASLPVRAALGQTDVYPSKRSTILVGYTAGGAADTIARIVAQYLFPTYGAVVENRPGAAGIVAAQRVATSPPDGYTMLQGNTGEMAINRYLNPDIGFEPDKALIPAAMLYTTPNAISVLATSPYKTLQDLLAAAKAKPGQITYGSTGRGTQSHIAGEVLGKEASAPLRHIPYQGYPQGIQDLLGGNLDAFFAAHPPSVSLLRDGKLRYLAIAASQRSAFVPDVPTVSEVTGIKSFDFPVWGGIFVPAKTPANVVSALNVEVKRILALPEALEKIKQQNFEVMERTPEQGAEYVKAENEKYEKIIKEFGLKAG